MTLKSWICALERLAKEHDSTDAASRETERCDFSDQQRNPAQQRKGGGCSLAGGPMDLVAPQRGKSRQMLRNHIFGSTFLQCHSKDS